MPNPTRKKARKARAFKRALSAAQEDANLNAADINAPAPPKNSDDITAAYDAGYKRGYKDGKNRPPTGAAATK